MDQPDEDDQVPVLPLTPPSVQPTSNQPLFGYNASQPVYWEYSSTLLSNRHLVIGGRSGRGRHTLFNQY